jgi:DNA invertase Pin-like site-specific DNA recombinase
VEGQRSVNRTSAAYHGVKIRREIVVVDVSGRHVKDDPQFQELFEELKDPTLSGVLVPEQSRIVRPESFDDWPILGHFQRNRKLIYTPTGRIDPNTPEGRMALTVGGMMSGEELINLRDRFARGKQTKRLEGMHVGGNQMLPKGVRFVRERNSNGKIIARYWEVDPVEMERMKLAFRLLFEDDRYETIAEKVGGSWTGSGLHRAMTNPIWIGIRRYEWEATGEEYMPKATAKNPKPKKRRKLVKRAVPLDVPTREQLERGEKPPIIEPIISLAEWDRAQEIIATRMTTRRKLKVKNEGRDRFLGNGITRCSCSQPMYVRYGGRGPHLDSYYCGSQYPHGPGCGMRSIKRIDLDPTIDQTITNLADADFLLNVLEVALAMQQTVPDPARVQRERALAKLEGGRKEMLAMVRGGDMTRDEFRVEMAKLEKEVRALEAQLPAPAPKLDPKEIVALVAGAFCQFTFLTFGDKRAILRGAVKEIIVDGHARTITTVTISGGYLGKGANAVLHSRSRCLLRSPTPAVESLPQRRAASGRATVRHTADPAPSFRRRRIPTRRGCALPRTPYCQNGAAPPRPRAPFPSPPDLLLSLARARASRWRVPCQPNPAAGIATAAS